MSTTFTADTPSVVDNDRDAIAVTRRGKEIREWSYGTEAERREKMLAAREFCEGWLSATAHFGVTDLLAVAKGPIIAPVGDQIYLGFQDEHGFWSVELPPDMVDFAHRWSAKRGAAIARATGAA